MYQTNQTRLGRMVAYESYLSGLDVLLVLDARIAVSNGSQSCYQ